MEWKNHAPSNCPLISSRLLIWINYRVYSFVANNQILMGIELIIPLFVTFNEAMDLQVKDECKFLTLCESRGMVIVTLSQL